MSRRRPAGRPKAGDWFVQVSCTNEKLHEETRLGKMDAHSGACNFRCPRCGRTLPLRAETARRYVEIAHKIGRSRLDISSKWLPWGSRFEQ